MNHNQDNTRAFVLTDVAGEHYWTTSGMFLPIVKDLPPPADVQTFATSADADREAAIQRSCGIHLRRVVVNTCN